MRGFAIFLLTVVAVVMIGATVVMFRKYERTSADFAESRTRYTEAINAIAEIQDSLYAITASDTAAAMLTQGLETEQSLTEPRTQQALDRIALINQTILRTKERIAELETRLKQSGVRVKGLEKMIVTLKKTVAEKETMLSELTIRVDSLQTTVHGLEVAVQEGQETIRARDEALEERQRELATVYVIMGTKKELKDSGVIRQKGGFLGIGRTVQLTGDYDPSLLTPLDTDQETLLRTESTRASVLSAQPSASYELKLESDRMQLRILDPREFRKVKHLVIMTG